MFLNDRRLVRAMAVGVLMILVACATSTQYEANRDTLQTMSVRQARAVVDRGLLDSYYDPSGFFSRGFKVDNAHASSINIKLDGEKGESIVIPLRDLKLEVVLDAYMIRLGSGSVRLDPRKTDKNYVSRVANALQVLRQAALSHASMDADEASFEDTARKYREAATKPAVAEEVRRFRVQAEVALRQKDFKNAANFYKQGVDAAPFWAEGHFNRALTLSEMEDYELAIREMKRYLLLVPNAPDARAARDKIYEWEAAQVTGKVREEPDPKGGISATSRGCFIATAAYGSDLHPHVQALRDFRDKRLLTNEAGRRLVATYYRVSPPIADYIGERETLRAIVRGALTPVVYSVVYPWVALTLILMLATTPFALRRMRARKRKG